MIVISQARSDNFIISPDAPLYDSPVRCHNDLALSMLLVVLEVALVYLILHLGKQPAKAIFHAGDPLTSVVVPTVPNVLALAMPLIHDELALVVAVLEEHSAVSVMISIGPVAFIQVATLHRDAVAEAVALVRLVAPLAFVEVSSHRARQRTERPLVEVEEGHRAVVEGWQGLVDLAQTMGYDNSFL